MLPSFTELLLRTEVKLFSSVLPLRESTIALLHTLIRCVSLLSLEAAGPGNRPSAFQRELRLIDSLDDIRNPPDIFKAEEIC